ncbi:MAG: SDR family oxidoreductase [Legionella sp.]|nr:SDR family oxidoreductase [Legionella sp.]
MQHLILGYGYCGYYLAQELLHHQQKVTAVSRHLSEEYDLTGLTHLAFDLNKPFTWDNPDTIIYYLIPPPAKEETDDFLTHFLQQSQLKAKKIIYFGSSGVYGNHQGNWVDEGARCLINHPRQLRRLDAEQQWFKYSQQQNITPIMLRIAGIYGPGRLPIEQAKAQLPVIETHRAPLINHIYVKDLAKIAWLLGQSSQCYSIYNVADGQPNPMGTLQQLVAQALHQSPAPFETWDDAWKRASEMKREFMQGSKQLDISRLKETVGASLKITPMEEAIRDSLIYQ